MSTFKEANQVRVSLKMKLVQYSWYNSCHVEFKEDGYGVVVNVKQLDNVVRKTVSPVIDGVSIRVEVS